MFNSTLITTRDQTQWMRLIEKCENVDPHYLPEYLALYEEMEEGESKQAFGGEAFLFLYGDGENYVFNPFLKRKIPDSICGGPSSLFDISSGYGYGGPLSYITDPSCSEHLWAGFFSSFNEYCRQNHVVSEFTRLNPMAENYQSVSAFGNGEIIKRGRVVYFDLTLSEDELLAVMNQSRRSCIRKMNGDPDYELFTTKQAEDFRIFIPLYSMTMARNQAEGKYYFPESFFHSLFKVMEHYSLDYIKYKGVICAASLILSHNKTAYLHLQASHDDFMGFHANELLIYYSALKLKKMGFRSFVLGGGVSSSEDSLFTYKSRFSPFTRDFYTYHKIHMPEEYDKLVEARHKDGPLLDPGYFPKYRSP